MTLPEGTIFKQGVGALRSLYRRMMDGYSETIYADAWTPAELRAIADNMEAKGLGRKP